MATAFGMELFGGDEREQLGLGAAPLAGGSDGGRGTRTNVGSESGLCCRTLWERRHGAEAEATLPQGACRSLGMRIREEPRATSGGGRRRAVTGREVWGRTAAGRSKGAGPRDRQEEEEGRATPPPRGGRGGAAPLPLPRGMGGVMLPLERSLTRREEPDECL